LRSPFNATLARCSVALGSALPPDEFPRAFGCKGYVRVIGWYLACIGKWHHNARGPRSRSKDSDKVELEEKQWRESK
jgi:hypothetical protein